MCAVSLAILSHKSHFEQIFQVFWGLFSGSGGAPFHYDDFLWQALNSSTKMSETISSNVSTQKYFKIPTYFRDHFAKDCVSRNRRWSSEPIPLERRRTGWLLSVRLLGSHLIIVIIWSMSVCDHNHIHHRHPQIIIDRNHHDGCFARHTLATAAILAGRALGCGVARFPLLFILIFIISSSSPCIGSPQPHPPCPHTSPSSYSPLNLQAHLNDRIGWARTMQQEALPSHSSDSSFDRLEIF